MPSSTSQQNNYYASHHRRGSQLSLASNNDQNEVARPLQSPNRSLVYLPASTYSQPTHSRDGSLAMATSPPPQNGSLMRSQLDGQGSPTRQSPDPRFWTQNRQYPYPETQDGLQNGMPLHKVRSNGHTSGLSASRRGSIEASRSTPAITTATRQRTSSIKDLVAKFDSPTDDIPPIPSRPGSRVTSRASSPNNTSRRSARTSDLAVETTDQYSTWSGRRAKTPSGTRRSTSQAVQPMPSIPPTPTSEQKPTVNTQDYNPYQKPLFGEILPQASTFLGGPGYGISSPRRRRGSEGSPMHSPNPMFPASADSEFASPISPTAWYRDAKVENGLHSSALTSHRRAQSEQSDMATSRSLSSSVTSPLSRLPQMTSTSASALTSGLRGVPLSRIPIQRSQHSGGSSSTISPPTSRAPSTQDRYPVTRNTPQSVPRVVLPTTPKASTPKRTPVTLTNVQSPSRRGQSSISQGEKSPSLRANIIVPLPKISPPLRSSRPRQPVSAASTAASRAKMAEKFEKAQRNSSERSTSSRSRIRPKELKNVDLEARRKNITQALDQLSRQSLRKSSIDNDGRDTPRAGFSRDPPEGLASQEQTVTPVPAVIVDEPRREDSTHYVDDDLTPEAGITQMPGGFPNDSPVRAETEQQGLRINVSAQPEMHTDQALDSAASYLEPSAFARDESEPNSAVTTGTEATMIDTEPQALTRPRSPHRTILSQVMGLRQASPLTPSSASCSESGADVSDRADDESVQIMLRNTQYLEGSPTLHHTFGNHFAQDHFPDTPDMRSNGRNSWTSSIPDDASDDDRLEAIQEASPDPQRHSRNHEAPMSSDFHRPASANHRRNVEPLDSLRSTMASDAYTVVDFVLQQNSSSGVVRSETVDDVAQRVLQQSPRHMYQQTFDRERVEELTLQQLGSERYIPNEEQTDGLEQDPVVNAARPHDQEHSRLSITNSFGHAFTIHSEDTLYQSSHHMEAPRKTSSLPTHQYDSSRGSEADWVTPYPASHEQNQEQSSPALFTEEPSTARASTFPLSKSHTEPDIRQDEDSDSTQSLGLSMRVTSPVSLPWDGYMIPRAPSHSPPPPPPVTQSFEDITTRFAQSSPITLTPKGLPPQIPRRITSQSQIYQHRSGAPSTAPSISSVTLVGSRQSSEQQNLPEDEKQAMEAQKRLKQRRHIIKELVDTEMTFERDMKVVVDIYQATAEPIASKADLAAIFINSEEVVQFSRSFGTQLKNTAKPIYDKSRTGRSSSAQPSLTRSSSYASTLDGDKDLSDADRDRQTRIGDVFLASAAEMEVVYKEYMVKANAANTKAQIVLQTEKGKLWTQMCHNESRDLTSAWDLPSLLVKPVQRGTKYKLFLDDLLKSTPADHPDYENLKRAYDVVGAMMTRINEAKKHAELIEQAMGRKRKDSSATKGFTLTKINRGTEKLKQNMGLAEAYEDADYTKLFHDFDERLVYFLTVIMPDQDNYRASLNAWIDKLCRVAESADAWVEVQPTKHMEMESKLRHFSQAARSIRRVGIEPHLAQVDKEVFEPIRSAFKMLMDFKQDPKGLLARREKKLLDYARFRNERDRTGKADRKATEKIEQWEALNREAKTRLTKLIKLSWEITVSSYRRFAPIHVPWFEMVTRNLAEAMSINASDLRVPELERDFKADFDPILSATLNLGICNGTLALEVSNMVTMNGSDSPRQHSTWSSANKRSISINSEGSHDQHKRNSGNFYPSPLVNTGSDHNLSFGSNRLRASSAASGQPRTPTYGGNVMSPQSSNSPQLRPGTSPGPTTADLPAFAPRVSLDAPSPHIDLESPVTRPGSVSTFFSASGAPSHQLPTQAPNGGVVGLSIFSSAMPMSDSPVSTRGPSFEQDQQYAHHSAKSPVLFTVASIYEFNIDRARSEAGWPYLTYTSGEIFDVIGEKGELWLSRNQDQPEIVGWIWNKHFMKLAE